MYAPSTHTSRVPAAAFAWAIALAIPSGTYVTSGYFAITNPRLRLGAGLRWPLEVFPRAWLWQEVHSGQGWPWYQRAYAVAVEPASTIPGHGMGTARAQGYPGVRFTAGQARQVVLEAVLFEADGPVADIAEGGRVQLA